MYAVITIRMVMLKISSPLLVRSLYFSQFSIADFTACFLGNILIDSKYILLPPPVGS